MSDLTFNADPPGVLSTKFLGLDPYVLIELQPTESDDDTGLVLSIGGGVYSEGDGIDEARRSVSEVLDFITEVLRSGTAEETTTQEDGE